MSDTQKGSQEPIAICGIGCRLPGQASNPQAFWELLSNARSANGKVPASRFNLDGFYHPQGNERAGSVNTEGGYFLDEDIRQFENSFFGINNLEATYMDPQQRKLLEVVYECLENAGVPLTKASGANIGCYVGNFTFDYMVMQMRDPDYLSRYSATGLGTTILSNRISHVFNLMGPSFVLDTACSSSLYCLHAACTALENGECDAAIVAGANLIQSAEQHMATMKAGVLSATSQCHTFDTSADGYGRGDGIGALYVKRLSDALRDGDPIRSVIRGSAVNANGKTSGISLPSSTGQTAVIRKAMARANLLPSDITYVECHGTGTKVGDAIELDGLASVFNDRLVRNQPLYIGSVKSNVGHSEAASGISSVIKATLALEHGRIPPTYGLKNVNPKLRLEERNFCIPTETIEWPDETRLRRIGVNSFGYGGANAHVIIEEAPRGASLHANGSAVVNGHTNGHGLNGSVNSHTNGSGNSNGRVNGFKETNGHANGYTNGKANALKLNGHSKGHANGTSNGIKSTSQTTMILPLSAATSASLEQRKADYARHDFGKTSMTDLAYTLAYKRTHFSERGFFIAPRNEDIANVFKAGTLVTSPRPALSSQSLPLAFVFTGQGSQWPGMCKQHFTEFDIFRNAIQEMDHVLKAIPHAPEWSLVDAILETDDPTLIHRPERSQPCCTAIQVGLVRLLESWGMMPTTTVGHSSGEIAAAFAAGHLSAAEAIVIAYYRGYCAARNTQIGAMMAVGLSEEKANAAIADVGLEGQVCVACVNSPEGVTVSGDQEPLDTLLAALQAKSVFARKLKTGGQAYHSHHMAVLGPKYQALLDQVLPTLGPSMSQPSGATLVSTVTGQIKASGFDSAYWRRNLESQVRFSPAIASIHSMAEHFFVELGPHTSMGMPIEQTLAKAGAELKYAGPIKRSSDSVISALSFAGQLWFQGFEVNWAKINNLVPAGSKTMPSVVTDLPPYKFDYGETLWNESRASIEYRQRKYPRHELLGSLVPGGNARDFIFRNVLKVDDVSWLKDHKLVDTIVFPGAGYLCMAMEAASQASDADGETTFELANVNITNALPLDEESSVELFTSLHRAPITNAATSDIWWDWTVTSHTNGQSTTHASGSIAVHTDEHMLESKYAPPQEALETTHKRVWYERFVKSGLNYGPTFESIASFQTPRLKNETFASATAPLLTTSGDPMAVYPVHPITLDALIQLAIVSTAKGVPKEMRALVPTRLSSVRVKRSISAAEAQLNARTDRTGFGYCQANAELIDAAGQVTGQLEGFRLAPYSSAAQGEEADDARHPVLRVLWKPDVHGLGLMTGSAAQEYAQKFADEAHSPVEDTDLLKLGAVLDLFAHKNPVLRILEVGNESQELTLAVLELLKSQTDFKRLATYTTAQLGANSALVGGVVNLETGERTPKAAAVEGQYDLVLCLTKEETMVRSLVAKAINLMTADSYLLSLCPSTGDGVITSQNLETLTVSITSGQPSLVLARKPQTSPLGILQKRKSNYLIVEREKTKLGSALGDALRSVQGHWVSRVRLEDLTTAHIPRNTTVFNLCELKSPLLSVCTDEEMAKIKIITDNASSLIWTTNANTLEGEHPDFALISGLSRALMLEQPSLRLFTYDIDSPDEFVLETADRLIALLTQPEKKIDYEFVQRNNVAHVSRFVPDDSVNSAFRSKQGLTTETRALQDAGDARLSVGEAGQLDSIYFIQQDPAKQMIGPEDVRIKVASVGINAKDYYVLVGRVDTPDATCQLECAGTVVAVGSAVTDFAAGDRVVAMAPSYFGTYQTLPQWSCYKLAEGESFDVAATLPLVYATAIYALQHRAQIQPGESVLIHSGAGGVGIAAIQLALQMGAEVYTTVSSEEKKNFLINTIGLNPSHIFSSRDTSFLPALLSATSNRGVDVILNSLTGDQLHATWKCCAPFGRFIEIGKADLTTAGRLQMAPFLKGTTFSAFDLSHLYHSESPRLHALWQDLLAQVFTLYRARKIAAFDPLKVFPVTEITQAYRYFSSRSRMGKVAISLEDEQSTIPLQPLKHAMRFDPRKSYVMIGCLGGLGRTFSRWMVSRGARRFAFLGRSGIDKPAARSLVEDLQASGAECSVVRGDVCNAEDVEAVVTAAAQMGSIGGVVQAAMGLDEAIFSVMSNKSWHTGIDPKVHGSWNLLKSLKKEDRQSALDFFLMTSSVSGSVGTATEANYCAGNHFLDHFARHLRRTHDIPAVAIGFGMISEVGYLHDNPEIEALLVRKGIQAIDADELIQLTDLALSPSSNASLAIPHAHDTLAVAHMLTGMEPHGIRELRRKGFEGTQPAMEDPRANLLASALEGSDADSSSAGGSTGGLPAEVAALVKGGQSLRDAVLHFIRKRFGNLVLLKFDAVDVKKPLAQYGMDSMIGAEFRIWFYKSMGVDIPLVMLLGASCTIESLRDLAAQVMESE
ncbi:hypothetical protein BJX65DRAFT_316007 [Aspergillus insuetus]